MKKLTAYIGVFINVAIAAFTLIAICHLKYSVPDRAIEKVYGPPFEMTESPRTSANGWRYFQQAQQIDERMFLVIDNRYPRLIMPDKDYGGWYVGVETGSGAYYIYQPVGDFGKPDTQWTLWQRVKYTLRYQWREFRFNSDNSLTVSIVESVTTFSIFLTVVAVAWIMLVAFVGYQLGRKETFGFIAFVQTLLWLITLLLVFGFAYGESQVLLAVLYSFILALGQAALVVLLKPSPSEE